MLNDWDGGTLYHKLIFFSNQISKLLGYLYNNDRISCKSEGLIQHFKIYFYYVHTSYLWTDAFVRRPASLTKCLKKNVLSWALAGTDSVIFIRQMAV